MEVDNEASQQNWMGTSMIDITKGNGPWNFYVNPLIPSKHHRVLFQMPIESEHRSPLPRCSSEPLAWDEDHVRMPYSPKNLYPVNEKGIDVLKIRWEIIKKALTEPITSSFDLENAFGKYNSHLPNLFALHYFFEETLNTEERDEFFNHILPGIIDLALGLPNILPGNIPLLKKYHCRSISLSQLQIASLLANAFLCTFPWRKEVAITYPGVNFVRLFTSHMRPKRRNCVAEKLKCICHYFRRILSNKPVGVVTFERKFVPKSHMPRWDTLEKNIGNTKIHISSTGTIEDNGLGLLQIDFANKNIGGGVLGYGCVQEEIRFVICPELIIGRLFVEQLGDGEAVIITGVERYSKYTGYGDDFKWSGNFIDETPFDEYRRRKTTISVIDATHFKKASDQFFPSAILRELNKAYVGFSSRETKNLAPVATGNWGCGAFHGSPYLKTLIQLMACCATNRDLVYFSFGNQELVKDFYDIHVFLGMKHITVMQLWSYLCKFGATKLPHEQLYSYIQQAYFDNKMKISSTSFFKQSHLCRDSNTPSTSARKNTPSTSTNMQTLSKNNSSSTFRRKNFIKESDIEEDLIDGFGEIFSQNSNEDIIPSSQDTPEIPVEPVKVRNIQDKLPKNHNEILKIMDIIDGNQKRNKDASDDSCMSLLSEIDKLSKKPRPNDIVIDIDTNQSLMDVDDVQSIKSADSPVGKKTSCTKITDYFTKLSKGS